MSLVENLYRNYGDFVLHVPRWEISDRGTTAIWGPSGSGKTTLFRVLIGLEPCSGWSWIWQGQDLAQLKVEERKLGVVFQSLELYPHMTARENIEFAAHCRRKDHRQIQLDIDRIANELMIEKVLNKGVHHLSGGERQRVAIARAVIGQPRMLLLDEPFSSLDQELRVEARKLISAFIHTCQIPCLIITHDSEDLVMAQYKVHLKDGLLNV